VAALLCLISIFVAVWDVSSNRTVPVSWFLPFLFFVAFATFPQKFGR
jgi:hypothetical protein